MESAEKTLANVPGEYVISTSKYRWIVLTLCWLAFSLTAADRSTWGPSSLFVGESLGVPLAGLGAFATAYYIGYVVFNATSGFLIDKLGGRLLIAVSLSGAGCFMFLFGSTKSAYAGIALQAIVGGFAGADYAAGVKLISSWFKPSELGRVMGIYTSATALGVLVANLIVPALIARYDWSASYHLLGGISIVVGIICYLVLRPGPVFTPTPPTTQDKTSAFSRLLANKNLVLLAIAGFGGSWGTYGFITWSNALMIKSRGLSPETAGLIMAIFAAMGVISKPVIGYVSDKWEGARRLPAMFILSSFSVLLIVFGVIASPMMFMLFAPFLGLAAYGYLPIIVALVPRFVGTQMVGSAAGMTNAFWQLGSAIVPIAVGAAFTVSGQSFVIALCTLALGPALGIIAMYFVDESSHRLPKKITDANRQSRH
ncbi:MFS transporter [Pseudomonas sp.]|uniref:MFS transporter n=1 Tax=Pseudomonas sp. TaxID=306 RepID=UPI0031B5B085